MKIMFALPTLSPAEPILENSNYASCERNLAFQSFYAKMRVEAFFGRRSILDNKTGVHLQVLPRFAFLTGKVQHSHRMLMFVFCRMSARRATCQTELRLAASTKLNYRKIYALIHLQGRRELHNFDMIDAVVLVRKLAESK
jgi:hypothetical protein